MDSVDTAICQVTHTLTAKSPNTDMVIKSILMSVKVANTNYNQKYQQAKANVAPAAATPVTADDATVTSPMSTVSHK